MSKKMVASYKFIVLVSSVQHQYGSKTRRLDIIVAENIAKFYLVVFRQTPRQDLSAHRMFL